MNGCSTLSGTRKSRSPPRLDRHSEKTVPTFSGSQTRSRGFVEGSHWCTGVCCLGFKTLSMVFLILLPRTME